MNYRGLLLIIASLPLFVAAGTWVLGGQVEVVVLRTFSEDGHGHDTRMWVVDHKGQPWLRGVRPNLEWIARIRKNSRVEIERRGVTSAYTARIDETPEARLAIDEAMAAKYGWIDRWHEFLMRFESIPIRLDPATGAG